MLVSTTLLLVTPAKSQAQPFPAEGYLSIDDSAIPRSVRNHLGSIFRIVELAHPEFSAKLSKAERDLMLTEKPCTERKNFVTGLNCKALEGPPNLGKQWFLPYLSSGTAFFAENSRTLWTAWHNFENQNSPYLLFFGPALVKWPMLKRQKTTRSLVPCFLLYSQTGDLVFDSRTALTKPRFLSNGDPIVNHVHKEDVILRSATDFARIEMPKEFRRPPIPLALEETDGSQAFLIGFPGPSVEKAAADRQESNGASVYANAGLRLPIQDLFSRGNFPTSEFRAAINHKLASTIFGVEMVVQPGFSGGPILNEKGELYGVLIDSLAHRKTKTNIGAVALRARWIQDFSEDAERAFAELSKNSN